MSDRPLSRIRQLIALCMLVAAVVTIGLAIAGALTGARPPGLSSHHRNDAWLRRRGARDACLLREARYRDDAFSVAFSFCRRLSSAGGAATRA